MTPANLYQPARPLRRGRRLPVVATALTALLVGACSVNPMNWIRSGDKAAAKAETGPVTGNAFSPLAPGPEAPAPITAEERKQMAGKLIADRENARYTDEVIRRQSEELTPPPGGLDAAREPAS